MVRSAGKIISIIIVAINWFDFNHLEHRVLRDGAYETDLPAIRGLVKQEGRHTR